MTEVSKEQVQSQAVGRSKEDWIGSQLKRVYGDVLDEDIPGEMLSLLGQLDGEDGDDDIDGDKS